MVREIWPIAREKIKAAIERTALSDFALVETEVLGGKQLLWLAIMDGVVKSAATTQLIEACGRKTCVLVACGGDDRETWLPLLADLEAFAKAEGCANLRIYGRMGWQRVLEGYRTSHVVLEKRLA